jgi:POLQ-like helicase
MIEFAVPPEHHIETRRDPAALFPLTVAIMGDLAAQLARDGASATLLAAAKQDLRFSAFFFDAFLNGAPISVPTVYLTLLASAAYYLSDLPGSSSVLANRIDITAFDPDCQGLDRALHWYLRGRFVEPLRLRQSLYAQLVEDGTVATCAFYQTGLQQNQILIRFAELRGKLYVAGSPRELLLSDLIFAVAKRRLEMSSRVCLPQFTNVDASAWQGTLIKPTFIREFWPAQRLLGEQGVFRGRSAIVQMPTSAGKTKATEILIRSAFFSRRTTLAVVVAPFRALCHEIRDSMFIAFRNEDVQIDEISDVPQSDFDLASEEGKPRVLILTPEKLLYILRQAPELAPQIGILIYDEGHQFDTGIRGVTYELLLTSLKTVVPATCQVILISAVITNAGAISEWLNGEDGLIVAGTDLHPTLRSVAFASWTDTLGRLEFLGQPDSGNHAYFVPRVLETSLLQPLTRRERIPRYFPESDDGQSVALYLGLKLIAQGSVAIFCGLKASVTSVCEKLADAYSRRLQVPPPVTFSNQAEVDKLSRLIQRHLGSEGAVAKCAAIGVFTHHGNTPVGIRLAVEHAMKESLVKMVVCTSTLAQGVNLPIRYLIVTGVYQGAKRISVRDFQNLIGRAGRSGMHTEGSVIFADPDMFDNRLTNEGRWRWSQLEELLDPSKAEECASSLLTLFDPLHSDDLSRTVNLNVRVFFQTYLDNDDGLVGFATTLETQLRGQGFSALKLISQLQPRAKMIDALESFIMSAFSDVRSELDDTAIKELARGTLAFHLATPTQRGELETLFAAIAKHVVQKVPEPETRKAYSKSLFGVRNSIAIYNWVVANTDSLTAAATDGEMLEIMWPILRLEITNSLFSRCTKPHLLVEVAAKWIEETTPAAILIFLNESDMRFGEGERPRRAQIDHVVELCENALAFEGVLVLCAVCESLRLAQVSDDSIIDRIGHLQKRLKYGLKTATAIALHELGFADRAVASDLAALLVIETNNRRTLRQQLRLRRESAERLVAEFPAYFGFVLNNVLNGGLRIS